jgi:hypothetical protein
VSSFFSTFCHLSQHPGIPLPHVSLLLMFLFIFLSSFLCLFPGKLLFIAVRFSTTIIVKILCPIRT